MNTYQRKNGQVLESTASKWFGLLSLQVITPPHPPTPHTHYDKESFHEDTVLFLEVGKTGLGKQKKHSLMDGVV